MTDNQLLAALAGAVIAIIGIAILVSRMQAAARQKRFDYLLAKYGDQEIVRRIMSKSLWVGQTADQLLDSLGAPADTDQKVLKTKTKEIWKYAHQGGNRYGLRITVENGVVAGWDERL